MSQKHVPHSVQFRRCCPYGSVFRVRSRCTPGQTFYNTCTVSEDQVSFGNGRGLRLITPLRELFFSTVPDSKLLTVSSGQYFREVYILPILPKRLVESRRVRCPVSVTPSPRCVLVVHPPPESVTCFRDVFRTRSLSEISVIYEQFVVSYI